MSKRRKNDWYPTPKFATEELLKRHTFTGVIAEPCVGDGSMLEVLNKHFTCITNDIDTTRPADFHFDVKTDEFYNAAGPVSYVITNPPFNQAMPILEKAYEHATHGVALLVRLSFLEPTFDRGPWLTAHPPTKIIVTPRISFTGDGSTDSVTTCWLIFDKTAERSDAIQVIPK